MLIVWNLFKSFKKDKTEIFRQLNGNGKFKVSNRCFTFHKFEKAASVQYFMFYRTWQLIKSQVILSLLISKYRNGSSKDVKCPSVNCWSQLIFFTYSKLKGIELIYCFSLIPFRKWLNKWSLFWYFQFAFVDGIKQDRHRLERLKWNDGILICVVLMTSDFS